MNDEERRDRAEQVMDHFIAGGYGADSDRDRQRIFLNDTACIPIEEFSQALRLSRQTCLKDGVVAVAFVVKAAVTIRQKRDPAGARNQAGGESLPRWHQQMTRGRAPQPFGLLVSGARTKEITP